MNKTLFVFSWSIWDPAGASRLDSSQENQCVALHNELVNFSNCLAEVIHSLKTHEDFFVAVLREILTI